MIRFVPALFDRTRGALGLPGSDPRLPAAACLLHDVGCRLDPANRVWMSAEGNAARAMAGIGERVAGQAKAARHTVDADGMHALRTVCRRERHTAEFREPLSPSRYSPVVEKLRGVTHAPGELHDLDMFAARPAWPRGAAPAAVAETVRAERERYVKRFRRRWKVLAGGGETTGGRTPPQRSGGGRS